MFEVSADETIQLACREGLRLEPGLDNRPAAIPPEGVSWTRPAFSKA